MSSVSTEPWHSARLALVFSCLGHAYTHLFGAYYFVVVLALEVDWGRPYHELIELWTLGAVLMGLGAVPAGWLADRWSAPWMMAVMFLGLGGASIVCGLASGPTELRWGLAGIGLFAAIYHPVGVAWIVRTAKARGKALGLNGVFGSLGIAASGFVTGALIDVAGWRAAFMVPAAISILTGLVLAALLRMGHIGERRSLPQPEPEPSRGDMLRGFGLLVFTMGTIAFAFHATQTSLPKLFELRLPGLEGTGTLGVGSVVALVYLVSGATQILGGHLADRFSLKHIYVGGLLLMVPVQLLMVQSYGGTLFTAATLGAFLTAGVLPAENMLLARFSSARHRGLAFAVKFVVAFCAAPLAVQLVAWIQGATGDFEWVFLILAGLTAAAGFSAFMLPSPGRTATATAG
jgi:FSR family fosmidomycin resistance protein-like MFS transporter